MINGANIQINITCRSAASNTVVSALVDRIIQAIQDDEVVLDGRVVIDPLISVELSSRNRPPSGPNSPRD